MSLPKLTSIRTCIPAVILKATSMRELDELDTAAAEGFLDRRQSEAACEVDPDEREFGAESSLVEDVGCCGCIIISLLILSPPTVLIGVILLSTGAILGLAPVFGCGLAVIIGGVIMGAGSAFVFVRMRSQPTPILPSRGSRRRHSESAQHNRSGSRGIEPMEAHTIELTFCNSEKQTGSHDQQNKNNITNGPSSVASIASKDRDDVIRTSTTVPEKLLHDEVILRY